MTLVVNGQSLIVPLPSGLTLPATLIGQQVTLRLSFAGGQPVVGGGDDDQGGGGNGGGDGGGGGDG